MGIFLTCSNESDALRRHLYLHLIANTALGIGPEVGNRETTRRGGLCQRFTDLVGCHAEHARKATVYVDLDCRVVELLPEVQVPKGRDFTQRCLDLLRKSAKSW